MPRTTNKQYLTAKTWLAQTWLDDNAVWAHTSPEDQRVLHDCFEPSIPMDPVEAIAHRKAVTAQQPSLPQRAGRALKRFEQVVEDEIIWQPRPTVFEPENRKAGRAFTVRAVLKPHSDLEKLTRAIQALAKQQMEQERAERERAARDQFKGDAV